MCRNELTSWMQEAGDWEKVVRPTIVETIAWEENQMGKPQTDGNKWVIFGEFSIFKSYSQTQIKKTDR